MDGSTISDNTVTDDGGGVYNDFGAKLNIQNGSTIGGAGTGNQAADLGGGIYNYYGPTTVDDVTISANTAKSGGGICTNDGTTEVTSSRILNNTATDNGGGVLNQRNSTGATDVRDSCIVGNSDISFFNDQNAEQIAIRNWWGAADGPNSAGADTVGGNVDTSNYLPAPILGCTPDLQIAKANDTGGNGKPGLPFAWTLTVSNTGLTHAVFGSGHTILKDDVPAGPTYGVPVAGNFANVTNGANIDCTMAGHILTCDAGGAGVIIGISGSFDVVFSVTPSDVGTLSNPAGICRVDPDGNRGRATRATTTAPWIP